LRVSLNGMTRMLVGSSGMLSQKMMLDSSSFFFLFQFSIFNYPLVQSPCDQRFLSSRLIKSVKKPSICPSVHKDSRLNVVISNF
jgi:hypothetical protein